MNSKTNTHTKAAQRKDALIMLCSDTPATIAEIQGHIEKTRQYTGRKLCEKHMEFAKEKKFEGLMEKLNK